ncbi:hypothetical protein ACVNF4_04145 [Streptomyces sp. S6]
MQRISTGAITLFLLGLLGVRRPRSLPVVAFTCVLAQSALHQWLSVGHMHHTHHSPTMLLAHALAALLVAVLLQRADSVFWRLAQELRERTSAVGALVGFTPNSPSTPTCSLRTTELPRRAGGVVLAHTLSRRGPPGNRSVYAN